MSGRIVHFEIPFDDGDRARAFYKSAFGWDVRELPDMGYTITTTGPVTDQGVPSEPGFINGGMLQRAAPVDNPVVTVDCADLDAALAKVEELGGTVVVGKQPVADMGFSAYFRDPEGNLMGLWQTAAPD